MTTLAVTLHFDMDDLLASRHLRGKSGDYLPNVQISAGATVTPLHPDLDRAIEEVANATRELDAVLHTKNEPLAIQRLYFAAKKLAAIHPL